jgi:hypothetical protein
LAAAVSVAAEPAEAGKQLKIANYLATKFDAVALKNDTFAPS